MAQYYLPYLLIPLHQVKEKISHRSASFTHMFKKQRIGFINQTYRLPKNGGKMLVLTHKGTFNC